MTNPQWYRRSVENDRTFLLARRFNRNRRPYVHYHRMWFLSYAVIHGRYVAACREAGR